MPYKLNPLTSKLDYYEKGSASYWSRTGTVLSPTNIGDSLLLGGDLNFQDGSDRRITVNNQTTLDTTGNGLLLQAGNGNGTADGGGMEIYSGYAGDYGTGGYVTIGAADGGAISGNGGELDFAAGGAVNGKGGDVLFQSGTAQVGTGGDIIFQAGAGTVAHGRIKFQNYSNEFAILDTSLIALSDKTFTFPDKDGTFAMLSDIGGGGYWSMVGTTLSPTTANDIRVNNKIMIGNVGTYLYLDGDTLKLYVNNVLKEQWTQAVVVTAGEPIGLLLSLTYT